MKKSNKFVWIVGLTIATGTVLAQDQEVQDKNIVETMIRDMYAKRIQDFEAADRKNAAKVCDYLISIFDASMISRDAPYCHVVGSGVHARFPNLYPEDLPDLIQSGVLPKSSITSSDVKGTAAVVKVKAPIGKGWIPTRVVYFLKKTNDRWRISNILAYSEWPLDTNREGGCKDVSGYYHFALPPRSEADFEDLPPACRKLELDDRRRNGWGR